MSVPAKQTRDVDLMHDDPERLLDVSEAAALLHVKTKTLYAWISRNKIPYRKICSLVRFHRGELIEWAKGQQQNSSKAPPNPLSVVSDAASFGRLLKGAANENSNLEAGRKRESLRSALLLPVLST